MNDQILRFLFLPMWQRMFMLTVPAVVVVVGFFFLVVQSSFEEIESLTADVEKIKVQVGDKLKKAQRMKELEKELEIIDKRLSVVVTQLPQSREVASLLREISRAGQQVGLTFTSFRPQLESKEDFYAKIPVQIAVEGHFHDLGGFFEAVSNMPRIVNIYDFSITGGENVGGGQLKASFQAVTFRFLEEGERKAAQAVPSSQAGGGRRR